MQQLQRPKQEQVYTQKFAVQIIPKFRKSKVDCLTDLVKVVQASAEVNHTQLVGNENGDVIVPTYNRADHFDAPFCQTALKGIKSFHHFNFDASQPGEVAVQTVCDGQKKKLKLLSDPAWRPQRTDLPPIIRQNGPTHERQCYLYEKIQEFCRPGVRDIVCPRPEGMEPAPPAPAALPVEPCHPPLTKKKLATAATATSLGTTEDRVPYLYIGHTSGYVINIMTLKRLCLGL